MTKEQLLMEIEDVIKTMPPPGTIRHDTQENHAWFGRASAAIEKWNPSKSGLVREHLDLFFSNGHIRATGFGLSKLLALLHQAQNDLRMETTGPVSVSVAHKMVFDYFDEIRKILELAKPRRTFRRPLLGRRVRFPVLAAHRGRGFDPPACKSQGKRASPGS